MKNTQQKILVIKLGALGDFIQALGPMAAIREHHKDAHITLLTTKPFENFAKDCGYFDTIWLDERPKFPNIKQWLDLRKRLNNGQFKRVYDLQNNDRTAFYFRLFKKPKPEWVGVAPGASHRNTSADRTKGHAFDGHVQTLGLAGIKNINVDPLKWMTADIKHFKLQDPYILLVPGCAPERPEKRWPAQKYGELAKALNNAGYQPVIIGTKAEQDAAAEIKNACPATLDLCNQTSLAQIATLARNAAGAIGNDTGPMHLIGATGTPCLVLFSSHSNPVKHAPKGDQIAVLQKDNLDELDAQTVLKAFEPHQATLQTAATKH